jgi:hypothetical protein
MLPRLALGGLLLLALLAAAHTLLWRAMARELEQGFAAWAEMRRAQGWQVEHGPPVRGGWPLAATLLLPSLRVEGGNRTIPGGLAWQSEQVVLALSPPRLDRLRVEMLGPQRLRLGTEELRFAADRLQATLPLEAGVIPREAAIEAERLRLAHATGPIEVRRALLEIETSSTATESEPALELRLSAQRLDLPFTPSGNGAGGVLGRRIELLSADASVTGPIPAGRHPTLRAEAWRDAGGTLELRAFQIQWGPVGASAAATLALDDMLQPMGAGTLRVTGAGEALTALTEAGVVPRRAAGTARGVLALLSRTPEDGGPPQVEVPVSLEDRTLAVARIPVARLAPLTWPQAPNSAAR